MKIENLKQTVKDFAVCNAKFAFYIDPKGVGNAG
jgi:hypothetical protein